MKRPDRGDGAPPTLMQIPKQFRHLAKPNWEQLA